MEIFKISGSTPLDSSQNFGLDSVEFWSWVFSHAIYRLLEQCAVIEQKSCSRSRNLSRGKSGSSTARPISCPAEPPEATTCRGSRRPVSGGADRGPSAWSRGALAVNLRCSTDAGKLAVFSVHVQFTQSANWVRFVNMHKITVRDVVEFYARHEPGNVPHDL